MRCTGPEEHLPLSPRHSRPAPLQCCTDPGVLPLPTQNPSHQGLPPLPTPRAPGWRRETLYMLAHSQQLRLVMLAYVAVVGGYNLAGGHNS